MAFAARRGPGVEGFRPFAFDYMTTRVATDTTMSREEIERAMEEAGWSIDASFAEYLILGHDERASILAPRWVWNLDDPVFELSDELEDLSYWVDQIPTPRRAEELLEEHGEPPEEERGNPYESPGGNAEGGRNGRET